MMVKSKALAWTGVAMAASMALTGCNDILEARRDLLLP